MFATVSVTGIYVSPDFRDDTLFASANIVPTAAVAEPATAALLMIPASLIATRRRRRV